MIIFFQNMYCILCIYIFFCMYTHCKAIQNVQKLISLTTFASPDKVEFSAPKNRSGEVCRGLSFPPPGCRWSNHFWCKDLELYNSYPTNKETVWNYSTRQMVFDIHSKRKEKNGHIRGWGIGIDQKLLGFKRWCHFFAGKFTPGSIHILMGCGTSWNQNGMRK